jgi:putative ABC transport system permease protein
VAHQRLLRTFVVSQLAIAVVLLVVAGLMIRSFLLLNSVPPGFNPKGVLSLGIGTPAASYPDIASQARFYDRLVTDVRTLTGVKSAASVTRLPMLGNNAATGFTIYGQGMALKDAPSADFRAVTQDYFKTMEIPLLKGRDFTDREIKGGPDVVIINKTMETRFFPNGQALGHRIQIYPEPDRWREIIGVAGDVKLLGLDTDINPAMYVPMAQNIYPNALRSVFLVVRTDGDPKTLVPGIRERLRALDKDIPLSPVQTMEDVISSSVAQRRLSMSLLVVFAVLAALLAAVGIYGVMAYTVTQRTQEIGIRLAMGARSIDVLKMVLGDGARLALMGVVIGLLVAFGLTRIIAGLLYGVSAVDPITFVCIPLLLAIVTLLASYLPARRASRVDPIITLRG